MHTVAPAPPRRTRAEAGRLIRAYAAKAAHVLDDHDRAQQVRRQLAVRLWADIDQHEFMELARTVAEQRYNRADHTMDDRNEWLDYLRERARVHVQNLTYPFRER